jgi:hypothetical protein
MEEKGVRRLIYLSNDAVREERTNMIAFRRLLVSVLLHSVAADHELNESMIKQSRLDWTIVRPPMLTRGERTGLYRSGEHINQRLSFLEYPARILPSLCSNNCHNMSFCTGRLRFIRTFGVLPHFRCKFILPNEGMYFKINEIQVLSPIFYRISASG